MARRSGRRDVGKERFWRKMMALWRRCQPMSVRDFCAEHGLSEQSYFWWRRSLRQRDRARPAPKPARQKAGEQQQPARFVPVRIVPLPVSAPDLQIVLGSGRVVRVPPGFDAATLRQLLAVLEEERPC